MPDPTLDQLPDVPPGPSTIDQPPAGGTDVQTGWSTIPPTGYCGAIQPSGRRFVLGAEIARGGMGEVYAARDTHLNRDVAVKVLQARLVGTAGERRFFEEARITGQLQHPGIPPVYDLGTLPDGRPYLAMKLIKGDTLADLLKRDGPGGLWLGAFEKVCEAVGYAHAHGVIHRDLKPLNVMVGAFGEVQVMDWGLAKVLTNRERERSLDDDPDVTADAATAIESERAATDATKAGSLMGTPAYMAPEQAAGAVAWIDRRTDVFGLGAVLCSLLTSKPPYVSGDALSIHEMAVRGELGDAFARLGACVADPDLVVLCKRCLSMNRADRPADAGEVAATVCELRQAADNRARAAEVERERATVRETEGRKRRRQMMTASGIIIAVTTVGGMVAVDQWQRAEQERDNARAEQRRVEVALDQVTTERQRTTDAVSRGNDFATAAREELLNRLRDRADQNRRTRMYYTGREVGASDLTQLHDLCRHALNAMPPGPERSRFEAETVGLLAIAGPRSNANELATAIHLCRELLATDPNSVPVRRMLAGWLFAAAEAGRVPRFQYSAGGAAVGGAMTALAGELRQRDDRDTADRFRELIGIRRSLAVTGDTADALRLARGCDAFAHRLLEKQWAGRPSQAAIHEADTMLRLEEQVYTRLIDAAPPTDRPLAEELYLDLRVDCLARQADVAYGYSRDYQAGLALVRRGEEDEIRYAQLRKLHRADCLSLRLLETKCQLLITIGDHARAFAVIGQLQEYDRRSPDLRYPRSRIALDVADYLGRCLTVVRADPSLSDNERRLAFDRYADAAIIAADTAATLNPQMFVLDLKSLVPLRGDVRYAALRRKHAVAVTDAKSGVKR